LLRFTGAVRGLRISWFTVGIQPSLLFKSASKARFGAVISAASIRKFGTKTAIAVLPEQIAEEASFASCMPENVVARKTNPV